MKVIQVISGHIPIENTGNRRWGAVELIQSEYQNGLRNLGVECEIKWLNGNGELITATSTDETINLESDIITNIVVYNIAEAKRFSKGVLRHYNKNRAIGNFATDKDLTLAAGNVVNLDIQGMFKGNYFIEQIRHEFIGSKSHFKVRKAIEGDY
jgi:hypothetical protein